MTQTYLILRRFFWLLPLALCGCGGCGCPPLVCPSTFKGDPISGEISYHPDYSHVYYIPSGTSAPIFVAFTPDPPADSEGWTAYDWAYHYGLIANGHADRDQYQVTLEDPQNNCSAINGPVQDNTDGANVAWSGKIDWTPGVYTLTATWDDAPNPLPIQIIPGTVCLSYDDMSTSAMANVNLYKTTFTASATSVERGKSATFTATIFGLQSQYLLGFLWTSNYYDRTNGTPISDSSWSGVIVDDTTVSCDAVINSPLQGTFSIHLGDATVNVTPRNWSLTPPAEPRQDNDANWPESDDLVYSCAETTARGGLLRDTASKLAWIFTPNPPKLDGAYGTWFEAGAYVVARVGDGGPDDPVWWVTSSDLKIDQETVLNKYYKPSGPSPAGAPYNWYVANTTPVQCFHVDLYLQALKLHEALGAYTTANGYGSGHYAQLLFGEATTRDVLTLLETTLASTRQGILTGCEGTIQTINDQIHQISGDHNVVKGNFAYLLQQNGLNPTTEVPAHPENCWRSPAGPWTTGCPATVTEDP